MTQNVNESTKGHLRRYLLRQEPQTMEEFGEKGILGFMNEGFLLKVGK